MTTLEQLVSAQSAAAAAYELSTDSATKAEYDRTSAALINFRRGEMK